MSALKINGLVPDKEFPTDQFEIIYSIVSKRWSGAQTYEHFSGAWNALAYRFHGAVQAGDIFQRSVEKYGAHPAPNERFTQERALFDLFSCGFASFESMFYGIFAIGSFLDHNCFPLTDPRDQQRVSPVRTRDSYSRSFSGDAIVDTFDDLFSDTAYQSWREVRNILTHRTAPGRRMFVSVGSDDVPPVKWKLNDLTLDESMVTDRLTELSLSIGGVMQGTAAFLGRIEK